ncbi:unnamed protein product [Spirodela intermedia]|uniref:phosphoserine transaminase n=1 Tax=Spirodela intermedia TaxID=51605 RepID=A0A7I8J061_SPIIN|nr:unnamed protein product [Spirodela intermedia]CAA6662811.1 unnamed protein product [Spirodela intermedia]
MFAVAAAPICKFLRLRWSSAGDGLPGMPGPFPSGRRRRRRWVVPESAALRVSCAALCPIVPDASPHPPPAHDRVFSFAATPASLPERVAQKARSELLSCRGGGATAAEKTTHRKKDLVTAIARAESALRELLLIPPATPSSSSRRRRQQLRRRPLNLCSSPEDAADYVITGSWSEKAYEEAAGHCSAADSSPEELRQDPAARFLHICADESVQALEFKDFPVPAGGDAVLVADMSSNFCSKPLDVSKFGLIYAGAQGNVGPAGLTVAIVRRDLIGKAQPGTPTMLNFASHADGAASLCNSPPAVAIYLCALRRNREKAAVIYEAIERSNGFYVCTVEDPAARSAMNVPFMLARRDLERKFVAEAQRAGMAELGAHQGAVAVAIGTPKINGLPLAGVERLAAFMRDFRAHHQRSTDEAPLPERASYREETGKEGPPVRIRPHRWSLRFDSRWHTFAVNIIFIFSFFYSHKACKYYSYFIRTTKIEKISATASIYLFVSHFLISWSPPIMIWSPASGEFVYDVPATPLTHARCVTSHSPACLRVPTSCAVYAALSQNYVVVVWH